jgi:hypothetical protein
MHYNAVKFVFYVSFHRGSKRKKNMQKKKGHFERSSCFRPFPETTFLERRRRRGAVLSSKKKRLSILATPTTPTPTPPPPATHQQIGARAVIFVGSAGVVPVMFFRQLY